MYYGSIVEFVTRTAAQAELECSPPGYCTAAVSKLHQTKKNVGELLPMTIGSERSHLLKFSNNPKFDGKLPARKLKPNKISEML
jgi:hypothetical protein